MCDQCPDDSDAVEEARWALDAAWEEVARKEDARIWKEERLRVSTPRGSGVAPPPSGEG